MMKIIGLLSIQRKSPQLRASSMQRGDEKFHFHPCNWYNYIHNYDPHHIFFNNVSHLQHSKLYQQLMKLFNNVTSASGQFSKKYTYLEVFAIQRHLYFIQWSVGKVSWNISGSIFAIMESRFAEILDSEHTWAIQQYGSEILDSYMSHTAVICWRCSNAKPCKIIKIVIWNLFSHC